MNSDNREYVNWDADIPVIRYKALDDTGCVEHGFSTRLGGGGGGPFPVDEFILYTGR